MIRLKYVVKLRTDVGQYTSGDTYIGMENVESQTGRYVETDSTYTDGTYCIVKKGDVLFGKLRPYLAKTMVCEFDGFSTNEFLTFSDFSGNKKFLFYLLLSDGFVKLVDSSTYGTKMPRASWNFICNVRIPLPSFVEQTAIVTFLDRRTAEIDTLLADLQAQSEMLDRYKRELIAETVTKGLDKSAALKDSGVDWIGEIPLHWSIMPLRAYLKVASEKNRPDLPLLSVEREKGVVDRETEGSENNNNRIPDDLTNYKVVRAGQFVMNKMKAWRGSYGVSVYDGIVSPAYYVFDLKFPNPNFFNYAIRSTKYIGFFGRDSYGIRTDQWDFKIGALKDIPFAVPPVEEQNAIAEYLGKTIPCIDGLITDITAQIEKLKQYRQIVIHDAVTGKIKVAEG